MGTYKNPLIKGGFNEYQWHMIVMEMKKSKWKKKYVQRQITLPLFGICSCVYDCFVSAGFQVAKNICFKIQVADCLVVCWETILSDGKLFVEVPNTILPEGSKERYVVSHCCLWGKIYIWTSRQYRTIKGVAVV